MKWLALAVLIAAVWPLSGWLRQSPEKSFLAWIIVGFLPFGTGAFHLYMAVISWAGWPGYVEGLEISVLDLLILTLFLSLRRNTLAVPFRFTMALYFGAVLLAVFRADVPMASIFYCWQLTRMFFVYFVVTKASVDDRVPRAIMVGMAIGLCFECGYALWQRFALGILQAGGTMGHQNFLGLMSHFVTFPWVALLLDGEKGLFAFLAPIAGISTAVLTVSRGTIGLLAVGLIGLFFLSAVRRWTGRKAAILAIGVTCLCLVTPIALSSFADRFKVEGDPSATDYDERAAFERAASMIIADHPFGVGANQYVVVANTGGYNTRAGVASIIGSDSANVHNIYYLVTAETGYLGLITFVFMLLQPMVVAFLYGWRNRRDRRGDLLIGLGTALLMVYIHSFFEWIFISFSAQYMFALDVGIIAGLVTQLSRRSYQHPARTISNPVRLQFPVRD